MKRERTDHEDFFMGIFLLTKKALAYVKPSGISPTPRGASSWRVLPEFKTGRPAAHSEPRVLLSSDRKRGGVQLLVLLSESTNATTSLTSHENLVGNCFTNAVVRASAMT